jgi:iron-sulfur cluster insertion protein
MDFKLDITESAKQKIQSLLNEKTATHFCIKLQGGGCSGLTYVFSFVDKVDDADHELHVNGIDIVVDKKSALFINNSIIDWQETLMIKNFKIINPQQKTSCSCGKSFSI